MLGMLIAYDSEGNILSTLDVLVVREYVDGPALGLVDFLAHEAQGGKFRLGEDRPDGIWYVPGAVGSGAWPEYLGGQATAFKVELDGGKIARLKHRDSEHVRDRGKVEKAITSRIKQANGEPADIRDLVGGPQDPLKLDGEGRTLPPGKVAHLRGVKIIRPGLQGPASESSS